jgi:hypothetical protein
LTPGEESFIESLLPYFHDNVWINNAEAREFSGKSEGSVKRFLRNLTEKGIIEPRGENKSRQYRLTDNETSQ